MDLTFTSRFSLKHSVATLVLYFKIEFQLHAGALSEIVLKPNQTTGECRNSIPQGEGVSRYYQPGSQKWHTS